ncbi:phage major capsid protein [Patescibacteria group bacterium]|uniref:Putative capsid protein n=1 Tax=viral metagenome TaxID=1070528 RepID=A0A6M3KW58_9ZZZZ|nr:phage major capsid protein [Patescibacteria group bacterium]
MAVATLTEYLNTLYTTTWAKRRAGVVDQVFEENKFLQLLQSKGMVKFESTDGRRLEIPLRVNKTNTSKFFGKGGTFTISDFDPLAIAYDTWKNLGDQMVRYWTDDKANGGSETAHLKMMNSKIDTIRDGLQEKVESALWADTGGSSVDDYNGLPNLIDDSPSTSATIHGINQSTAVTSAGVYYWRNQQKTSGGAFSVYGESDMTNLYNTCSRWGKTDLLISDQTTHELGEAEALERVRVVNKEAVDLGLDHITFKSKIWIWSPQCTTGYTYFIDRNHFGFTIDPSVNMVMGDWKEIPNQFKDVVTQIVQRGNTWVDKRQCHGVLTGQAA